MLAHGFDPIPWHRQPPIESVDDYALFQVYLALDPPRRAKDVVRHFRRVGRRDVSLDRVEDAEERCHWLGRAGAWDDRLAAAVEVVSLELAVEEARAAARQLRIADVELAKLERLVLEDERPVLDHRSLAAFRREATHDRRVARGEVTERVAVKPELRAELEGRSTEELLAIVAAAKGLAPGR